MEVDRAALLPALYRSPRLSGWSDGMLAVTAALLDGCTLPDGPILELGCGNGRLLAALQSRYPARTVYGAELHPLALVHAVALRPAAHLLQAHLATIPSTSDHFALVVAMDALDQQGVALDEALAESWRILRPGGILLMRVSAYPWLKGPHDAAFNTARRYVRPELAACLVGAGFGVVRMTYANALLGGPAVALRLLQRWGLAPFWPGLYETPELNAALEWSLRCEARWLRRLDLPAGLSLYALARKPD